MKLSTLAGKERTLQLAGTMALKNRKMSPIEKLRQTRGMVTIKRVPDVFETKNALAQDLKKKGIREYSPPKDPEFRNFDTLAFGQKDFALLTKPDQMENPHGLSAFEKKPKFHFEKEQEREKKRVEAQGLEGKEHWVRSHVLPATYVPISQELGDKYAKGVKKERT